MPVPGDSKKPGPRLAPVRVAVVDSGVHPLHPHVVPVAGGVRLFADDRGRICQDEDFRDRTGHGTAIAGIIRAMAPEAELYGVNILDEALRTCPSVLAAALAWAVDHQIDVVNVSISTHAAAARPVLERGVAACADAGVIVVAAAHNSGEGPGWPCACAEAIGVQAGDVPPGEVRWHPEGAVDFSAHGQPRPLPGLAQGRNLRGNSFAAAWVAGRVARVLGECPGAGRAEVMRRLRVASGDGKGTLTG